MSQRERFDMRRGFTLVEVLIMVVILAVLAGLMFPRYLRTGEKHRARQAVTYLHAIRLAEDMHRSKTGSYSAAIVGSGCDMTSLPNAAAIRNCLGIEITTGSYDFSVTAGAGTFTATAVRVGGACTITLDQAGTFTTTSGCPVFTVL